MYEILCSSPSYISNDLIIRIIRKSFPFESHAWQISFVSVSLCSYQQEPPEPRQQQSTCTMLTVFEIQGPLSKMIKRNSFNRHPRRLADGSLRRPILKSRQLSNAINVKEERVTLRPHKILPQPIHHDGINNLFPTGRKQYRSATDRLSLSTA